MKRLVLIALLVLLAGSVVFAASAEDRWPLMKTSPNKLIPATVMALDSAEIDTSNVFSLDLAEYAATDIRWSITVTAEPGDSITYFYAYWSNDNTNWTALAEVDSLNNATGTISSSIWYPIDSLSRYFKVDVITITSDAGGATSADSSNYQMNYCIIGKSDTD